MNNSSPWEHKKISEFAEVITGGTPSTPKKEYWDDGTIPWLASGDLKNCRLNKSRQFITQLGLDNSAAKLMPRKTVLIALTGATTGQTAILEFEASANQSVTGILPSKEHYPEFLFYYLRTQRTRILSLRYGAAQPHISQGFVKELEIPLPPLDIQRKIASILEKAESAKQKRQEANRLTDEFLKSTFLDIFGDPISNTKGWEYRKLGEALDVRDGTHDTPKYIAEGIPLITSKNLKDGKIDFDNIFYISQADYKQIIKRSFVETGDILYGMIGTIGSPVIVNTDRKFGIKNVALFKFRGRKVNNYYIKTLFEDDFLTKKLLSEKRGGNQKFVSLNILRNFNIPLPPFELQKKFANLVQKVEALKSKQQESKQELDNLFNSLMQKVFKGEIS